MTNDIRLQNLIIHGTIFLEDDSERIIEIFKQAEGVERSEELNSQLVNIDNDDPSNSALVFSDGLPDEPVISPGTVELITLSVDDEGDISLSIDLSPEIRDSAVRLFNAILSQAKVHVTDFDLEYKIDRAFSDLLISIDGPERFDYKGVKFGDGEYDYIVQSTSSGRWVNGEGAEPQSVPDDTEESDQEEATSVSIFSLKHFDVDESGDFIERRIQDVEKSLELITS